VSNRNIATRILHVTFGCVALLALVAADAPPNPHQSVRASLDKSRAQLVDHFADVTARGGSPAELLARIDADLSAVGQLDANAAASDWETVTLQAQLDESLVQQLVSGTYVQASDVRGAGSLVVPASADKTSQFLALYFPKSYDPTRQVPLIIMLHGQGQTESELLATPFLRALADQSGAIFAAPFARGDQEFDNTVASTDVYDALDVLEKTISIDRRRVYLAGFSMGGFAIFTVAPIHPERWSALLAIAGTLTNSDKQNVVRAMVGKRVFLVIGTDDPHLKAEYVRGATAFLSANGVDGRYYEQPRGLHSLPSLQPAVERAWRDMFSGVRNVAPDFDIPSPQPTSSRRT
jgi:predicted esterase